MVSNQGFIYSTNTMLGSLEIDAMSRFGVKSILRRDIVTDNCWFWNSSEIYEYLSSQCESWKSYVNLGANKIDKKQSNKKGFKIKWCMTQNIFRIFTVLKKKLYNKENLCECEERINLNFSSCLEESVGVDFDETDKEVAVRGNAEAEAENDCNLDNDDNDATRI